MTQAAGVQVSVRFKALPARPPRGTTLRPEVKQRILRLFHCIAPRFTGRYTGAEDGRSARGC